MANMISVFSDFTQSDSLFQKMTSMGAPWSAQQAMSMDMAYFTQHSGLKTASSFVTLNLQSDGSPNSIRIAQILWDLYGVNWNRLWNAYNLEYNPIDNYNIKETVIRDQTDDRTIGKKGTLSSTVDGTINQIGEDNGTSTLEHGEKIDDTRNINNFRNGFNSTAAVPTDSQTQTGSETHSGTDTTTAKNESTQDVTSKDIRSDTTSEDTTDNLIQNENITRNRVGNVGQNSYQELLNQEFETWKWNFFWQVFADCDTFLCLQIYDQCSSVN